MLDHILYGIIAAVILGLVALTLFSVHKAAPQPCEEAPEYMPEWPAPEGKPAGHGKPKVKRAFRPIPLSERLAIRQRHAHDQEVTEAHDAG